MSNNEMEGLRAFFKSIEAVGKVAAFRGCRLSDEALSPEMVSLAEIVALHGSTGGSRDRIAGSLAGPSVSVRVCSTTPCDR
jgi:hypothetical protein